MFVTLSFPLSYTRVVLRKSHRWRFGMFKRLTDATYLLARQAIQLRKERPGSKPLQSAILSYASKTQNNQKIWTGQLNRVENNIEKSLWKNKIRKKNLRRNLSLSTSAWRRSLKIWRVKLKVKLKSKWIIYEKFLFCGHSKLEADSNPIKIGPRTLAKKWPSRLLKGRLPSMISSS